LAVLAVAPVATTYSTIIASSSSSSSAGAAATLLQPQWLRGRVCSVLKVYGHIVQSNISSGSRDCCRGLAHTFAFAVRADLGHERVSCTIEFQAQFQSNRSVRASCTGHIPSIDGNNSTTELIQIRHKTNCIVNACVDINIFFMSPGRRAPLSISGHCSIGQD
jgi:hypothetical protein